MNALTGSFFVWLLRTSWQAAILVLLVLGAQWALRKRLNGWWRHALWLLVLVRLLPGFAPRSALSVYNFARLPVLDQRVAGPGASRAVAIPQIAKHEISSEVAGDFKQVEIMPAEQRAVASFETRTVESQRPEGAGGTLPVGQGSGLASPSCDSVPTAPRPTKEYRPTIAGICESIWLLGVVLLALRIVVQNLVFSRKLRRAEPVVAAEVTGLFAECKRRMGVRVEIRLVRTSAVKSPALYGLFRPTLLLPPAVFDGFDHAELKHIFLHELAHVKRRDMAVHWVATLLQAAHWFNPVVWFGLRRMSADRELACDELALSASGDAERRAYGETIIKLVEHCSRPAALPGLMGILENNGQMTRRIEMIAGFRKQSRRPLSAMIALLALAVVSLTDARPQAGVQRSPKDKQNQAQAGLVAGQEVAATATQHGSTPKEQPATVATVALIQAIQMRQWTEAARLIDSGVPVNGANEGGWTPLGMLVGRWVSLGDAKDDQLREEVLNKLLAQGADPFAASVTDFYPRGDHSPVEQSMDNWDHAFGDRLLTHQPSPSRFTAGGDTALHLAAQRGRTNAMEFLLAHGFSADTRNRDGLTALQELAGSALAGEFVAATNPPPFFVHYLRPKGPQETACDAAELLLSRGATVDVFAAAGLGLTNQLAALLRAHPALVNARDSFGRTPLHCAAPDQTNAVALLLRMRADPSARTTWELPSTRVEKARAAGSTPLHLACLHENAESVRMLLQAGANAGVGDADGNTPLHLAAHWGATNCAYLLIRAHAPLEATNHLGKTPLRVAVESGSSPNVEQLLNAGARLDPGPGYGTLLDVAAGYAPAGMPTDFFADARGRVIPVLLAHGLKVDARDREGRTAFQRAVEVLNLKAMEVLLANGADINATDAEGNTALHLIATQSWDKVSRPLPLQQNGSAAAVQGQIMLQSTNISVTEWMLGHGASVGSTNHQGWTAIELLCNHAWSQFDEKDVVSRIAAMLKAGAKVSADRLGMPGRRFLKVAQGEAAVKPEGEGDSGRPVIQQVGSVQQPTRTTPVVSGGFKQTTFYDAPNRGQKKMEIAADSATPVSDGGQVRMSNLDIRTYRKTGELELVMHTPTALFEAGKGAHSDGVATLRTGDGFLQVAGSGFEWRAEDGVAVISNSIHGLFIGVSGLKRPADPIGEIFADRLEYLKESGSNSGSVSLSGNVKLYSGRCNNLVAMIGESANETNYFYNTTASPQEEPASANPTAEPHNALKELVIKLAETSAPLLKAPESLFTAKGFRFELAGGRLVRGMLDLPVQEVEGVVLLPNGEPAVGAQVAFKKLRKPLYLREGQLEGYPNDTITTTDAKGNFRLPGEENVSALFAVHGEGYARIPAADLKMPMKITLQAWGKIEGVLRNGRRPATNEYVELGDLVMAQNEELRADRGDFKALTDSEGGFVIQGVPPGVRDISRFLPNGRGGGVSYLAYRVEVKPGEVTRVTLGGEGRPVTGRLAVNRPEVKVDWSRAELRLRNRGAEAGAAGPAGNANRPVTPIRQIYRATCLADGSFSLEDVPAGTYELSASVSKPSEETRPLARPPVFSTIAEVTQDVVVPPVSADVQAETLDVGTVRLLAYHQPVVGEEAAPIETMDVLGRPLKLSYFRGKYVLLDMERSLESEEEKVVEFIQKRYQDDDRLVILTLCSPAQSQPQRVKVSSARGLVVQQGDLGDSARTAWLKDYNVYWYFYSWGGVGGGGSGGGGTVTSLPAIYLVGPDGKFLVVNLHGEEIRKAVEKELGAR